MPDCVKISRVIFPFFFFFWVTSTTKVALRNQTGVSEFLLSFSKEQYCSPSYLGFSFPCARTLYLETCSSSWPSAQIPTSTPPCTSSFLTCPLWTSVSPPPPSQRCVEHPDTEQSYYLWSLYHPGVCVCVFCMPFAGLNDFLLPAMAYDHFLDICHPLH